MEMRTCISESVAVGVRFLNVDTAQRMENSNFERVSIICL